MKTWIDAQLNILKRKAIKLGKLLLAVLVIWATIRFDAFWITLPALAAYHFYMIPTYWNNFLERERRKFKEHLAGIDTKYTKVEMKERFGYKS